jgi:uncharacterized BrkB/YihY/UPF0761 family membrane protein
MLSQSDIQGRLRLLRYGLIVVVVVSFLISLLAPVVSLRFIADAGLPAPGIGDFLGTAIGFTVVVAIVAVIIYCVYYYLLTKRWPWAGGSAS